MIKTYIVQPLLLSSLFLSSSVFAQECDSKQPSITPNSRYQLLNAGREVKDLKTGLIWQRCLAGEQWNGRACTGEILDFSNSSAKSYISQYAPNWRLPSIDELLSLDSKCWQPAINTTIFPPNPERYDPKDTLRSSTIFVPDKREAQNLKYFQYDKMEWYWAYETAFGQKSYKAYDLPMRLVRR